MRKRLLLVFLALAILGFRYYFAFPEFDNRYVGSYRENTMTLRGTVITPPEESFSFTELLVSATEFKFLDSWFSISGTVRVYLRASGSTQYGDLVEIEGFLSEPSRPDPRISALMRYPEIRVIQGGQGNYFLRKLFELRRILVSRLEQLFPEPSASFASGILLGVRNTIPKEIILDFRRSGLTHIIALSGFNIIILIEFVSLILGGYLSRKSSILITIVLIAIFTLMVGAAASVVRAAIMGSLGLIARLFGRKSSGMRILWITAYFMVFHDPFIAIYDIGFQLSFAATAGILLFAKRWQERLRSIPSRFSIKETLITTCAAQVFTLPLLVFYFRGISIISPLANLPVLPLIPLLMLGSFLSIILGKLLAAPTWILFKITLALIHFFASLPFAYIDFGSS